jgi:hypothetical protein
MLEHRLAAKHSRAAEAPLSHVTNNGEDFYPSLADRAKSQRKAVEGSFWDGSSSKTQTTQIQL